MFTDVARRAARVGAVIGFFVGLGIAFATFVLAAWPAAASPSASRSQAMALGAGNVPIATTSAGTFNANVSWAPVTGGAAPAGYEVRAFDATTGSSRTVGDGCSGVVTGTSCAETSAPSGSWNYSVAARLQLWSGAQSAHSASVTVDGSYRARVLADAPVGYWRLGESAGTTAVDETAHSNGTYSGGYTLGSAGALVNDANTAVDLNGSNGYVAVPSVAALALTGPFSLEAWVNLDSTAGTQWIIDKGSYYYLYVANGQLIFGVLLTGGLYPFVSIPIGPPSLWQHYVGTYDGANLSLYRNGVRVAQSPLTGSFLSSTDAFVIGAYGPGAVSQTVDGRIDDVAIYPAALTGTQILTHYMRGQPVHTTSPVAASGYANASWAAGCASTICGTTAAERGIASVAVSVRQGSGNYWNGTAFASVTEVLVPASGTTSWNLPFVATNFPAEGAYTARVVATDRGGTTFAEAVPFTIDRTAPTVSLVAPTSNGAYNNATWNALCTSTACGYNSDAGSGMATVVVSLRQGTGNYWNETSFGSVTEVMVPTIVNPVYWYLPFPGATFPAEGSYTAHAVATDQAGNTATTSATFIIDRTVPTLTITFPTATAYTGVTWNAGCASAICGTASDSSAGVVGNAVEVRQVSTGFYWNGASFSSAAELSTTVPGLANWSLAFPAANFPATGSYTVTAISADAAGNIAVVSTTFTIDRTPPAVAVTFPVASGVYGDTKWDAGCASKLCGTATAGATPVASVATSIRQGTGNYWNGTSFASATEVMVPASGTTSWNLALGHAAFPAEGSYTVRAEATGTDGLKGSASATFTIDRTAPAPTATALVPVVADGVVAAGDEVRITFSELLDVSTICSSFSGTGDKSLVGAGVVVTYTSGATTDTLTVSAGGCTIGSLVTGKYLLSTSTFSGAPANDSRVTWTAATRILTIHLGARASGTNAVTPALSGSVTFTANAALRDLAGNAVSTAGVVTGSQRF